MKKTEQLEINEYVENIAKDVHALMRTHLGPITWVRLYHCSADWACLGDWAILRSYSTIVAAYNWATGEFFDFLRLVYGYTATSAQHITKFRNYCHSVTRNWGTMYRWYAV